MKVYIYKNLENEELYLEHLEIEGAWVSTIVRTYCFLPVGRKSDSI